MSLETEIKKVAINMQQMTDAMVQLTAAMMENKANEPVAETVEKPAFPTFNIPAAEEPTAPPPPPSNPFAPPVQVGPQAQEEAPLPTYTVQPVTVEELQSKLGDVTIKMGDGGATVRGLLKDFGYQFVMHIPEKERPLLMSKAEALLQ